MLRCWILGSWIERFDEQESHENHAEMDEREAEGSSRLQPRWGS